MNKCKCTKKSTMSCSKCKETKCKKCYETCGIWHYFMCDRCKIGYCEDCKGRYWLVKEGQKCEDICQNCITYEEQQKEEKIN